MPFRFGFLRTEVGVRRARKSFWVFITLPSERSWGEVVDAGILCRFRVTTKFGVRAEDLLVCRYMLETYIHAHAPRSSADD